MNESSLDELIAHAVDAERGDSIVTDPDALFVRVLEDPDIKLLLKGIANHDRSEGLEDIYLRDIRHKMEAYLDSSSLVAEKPRRINREDVG